MSILNWLSGGIVKQFTQPLNEAWRDYLSAEGETAKLEHAERIRSLENQRDIAVAEAGRAWSATSVGRWLIVVPFGVWWLLIYFVSIINPLFGLNLVILDVPARINEMAMILVPAIVIADSGALIAGRFTRR